ncbi:MAG: hypothetical protein KHX21_06140 [Clostridium sp.]|jgi:hypothetical protein|nr:hypothetical protein [Clostridium sp.]
MNIKHAKIILALLIAALTLALCGCSGGDIQPPAETDAPRQPVRIEVSDTKAIARMMDKMGVEYSIASDTAADIFADVQATELIEKAAKENCTVFSMKERDESLESFYMNLIGGARND